jgi:hypothetical protein
MKSTMMRPKLLVATALLAALSADARRARGSLVCANPEKIYFGDLQPQYHVGAECRQVNDGEGAGLTPARIDDIATIQNANTSELELFVCPLENHDDDRSIPWSGECEDTAVIRVLDQHESENVQCYLQATDPLNLTSIQSNPEQSSGVNSTPQPLEFAEFNPSPWDSWSFQCEVPPVDGGNGSGIVAYYMFHFEYISSTDA